MEITAVILAAGQGTRMKSERPKVLHKLACHSFIEIILATLSELKIKDIRIVASDELISHPEFAHIKEKYKFTTHIQKERLGTAHALKAALNINTPHPLLVLNGDAPLIEAATIKNVYNSFNNLKSDVLNIGFKTKKPTGYGRLVTIENDLIEIIEEKDASDKQRLIELCNSGIYMISAKHVKELLEQVSNKNAKGEYYLPDIVKIGNRMGLKINYIKVNKSQVLGINDQEQRSQAEQAMQRKLRKKAFQNGVIIHAPETVFLAFDTELAENVTIHQYVIFGPKVKVASGCEILPFTTIEGTNIGENSKIGPFARIRPNTTIGKQSKIGNFVEVKSAKIHDGVKASHLTYIGDATIEDNVNIGAGTIFCNYDGYSKHQTIIGQDTFIGSNSALVAPINIGKRAIVGAGSVITEDINDDDLSVARARQTNFKQKAEIIRSKKTK